MKRIWNFLRPTVIIMMMWMALGSTGVGVSQTPQTRLFVAPETSEATTCALHTIAIRVADVVDLTGYHLEVDFDPAVVNVTQVENGGFLDGAENEAFYEPTNAIDNVNGKIIFGMVQQNSPTTPMTPKSGPGDLILITLQALVPNATSPITIDADKSMLVDWPNAYEVTFTTTGGEVSTEACQPTDLLLSNADIPENEPVGTVVGVLSTVDSDIPNDAFTYTLVAGTGDDDNASFTINGDELLSAESFDFETKVSYTIRVRSTDQGGLWVEKVFSISILDVNEAPLAYDQDIVIEENLPVEITLIGFDEDGDILTYDFPILSMGRSPVPPPT